jgi:hypothetical protein
MWERGCIKMTIEWLAGNRLRGTTAERPVGSLASPSVGGWVELGRTTSGSTITDLDVTGFGNKRYYMVLGNLLHDGNQDVTMRCGQASTLDTGSTYSSRRNENGGTDTTDVSRTNMILADIQSSTQSFGVNYFTNLSTKEKLQLGHMIYQGTAGAGNAPARTETANKWANTSNALDSLSYDSGSWLSGSEMVVLGWDPTDTHTTNFWEELASVDLSGGAATNIDSGTITAKKYLWIQYYTEQSADSDFLITFNADTGSNYARRYDNDGGTETTGTSLANFTQVSRTANLPQFTNMFIVNNSANEKLIIAHTVYQMTAGAGTATARWEAVGKWANTSAQITSMKITSGSGNLASKTVLKIWGSD